VGWQGVSAIDGEGDLATRMGDRRCEELGFGSGEIGARLVEGTGGERGGERSGNEYDTRAGSKGGKTDKENRGARRC
jgi:hypothetical protein